MLLIELIYFFFLVIFAFYIPGNVLLSFFKINNKDFIISLVLSFAVGISAFLFSVYLLSWIKLEYFYNLILLLFFLFYLRNFRKVKIKKNKNLPKLEMLIIALGTVFTSYIMWRSGSIEGNSLVFYGVNTVDAIYHLSLIGNLKFTFPPTHPGISNFPIAGYNFFYDMLLANFSKFYKLQVIDLYFRYFALFLAIFYGLSGWALGKFMGMKRISILIFLTLIYFAQGFSKLVFQDKIFLNSGIVHTIANIVDPSVILSICLLFSFYILIFSKRTKYSFLISALVIGVLPMIKVYTGFLTFSALGVLFLFLLIRKRDLYYLKILIPALIIAVITYFPTNFGYGKLVLAPGLMYRHYLESISNIYKLDWYNRLLVYEAHNNYIKIILYKYVLILPLFYIPSLGIRLVNIIYIKKLFSKSFYSDKNIFWITLIILGFLIPSLFIQSIAVFVTIQFLWITYFILLIPTAYSLTFILEKIGKRKALILTFILFLLFIPDNLRLIEIYSRSPLKIDLALYNVAKEISKLPENSELISLNTTRAGQDYQTQFNVPLISALSSRSVYFEPELMEFSNTEEEIVNRKKRVGDLNELLITCQNASEINNSLEKFKMHPGNLYILDLKRTKCLDDLNFVELIFRDSIYTIYRIL